MSFGRLTSPVTCSECGFTSTDLYLVSGHNCNVQEHGGRCEDFPACGHEYGDCNGLLYGSDESIKAEVFERMMDPNYDPYYDTNA